MNNTQDQLNATEEFFKNMEKVSKEVETWPE